MEDGASEKAEATYRFSTAIFPTGSSTRSLSFIVRRSRRGSGEMILSPSVRQASPRLPECAIGDPFGFIVVSAQALGALLARRSFDGVRGAARRDRSCSTSKGFDTTGFSISRMKFCVLSVNAPPVMNTMRWVSCG